jgi:hypothetical protein
MNIVQSFLVRHILSFPDVVDLLLQRAAAHSLRSHTCALSSVFPPHMESTDAPPVADKARCFRGSAPVGGRGNAREPAGATAPVKKTNLNFDISLFGYFF